MYRNRLLPSPLACKAGSHVLYALPTGPSLPSLPSLPGVHFLPRPALYRVTLRPVKAVVCRHYGPPQSLVVENVPSPTAGPGDVVVAANAASINFPDLLIIQNQYQIKPPLPFVVGSEVVGVVKSIGEGVQTINVGDKVTGFVPHGAFADEVRVPENQVALIPNGMDWKGAAAFGLVYSTAEYALCDRGSLREGETLVVLGAAGGVGLAAIEVGRALGARVIACASSSDKLAVCRDHGATATVNYATEDLRERVRILTNGRGADVVFDPVGGGYTELAVKSIAWQGRLLVVGFASGDIPLLALNLPLLKGCSIVGVHWGEYVRREPQGYASSIKKLAAWYAAGKLRPHISATFPLERAWEALEVMAERRAIGKVVIRIVE